ncbi:MAG: 4-(cytidine 5'-diphospho)-2-C-methyl-D-erythritol kinase [Rhodospirillales bacterium CG15_BIG_FIL_POST_REV_8_21_14_020_66_15]|nr:MAG: 4-(cytidine 5'-diphospho)-2-C-methyl-D-erythritol kinase [Rhodospirillales bacterium CG15_BIG_FIL_POST_REV_8_21_14_020_66_15]
MADSVVTVAAPAKLNLYLHVTGRRDDGYHLLDSLIAFADVGDEIKARAAADGSLTLAVKGPFAKGLADEADNLVLRAARKLRDAAGVTAGAHMVLEKRLPVASGIGGGSADAAATLKALTRLWGVEMAEADMRALALSLGADVPVCWVGRPAFVGGIGDEIEPAPPLPAAPLLLVNARVPVSTPAVFKARSGPFQTPGRFRETPIDAAHLAFLLQARGNGLTEAARVLCPPVAGVLAALEATDGPLLVRMSGSGGTCFALYETADAALAAAATIYDTEPDWWVAAGRLAPPADGLN